MNEDRFLQTIARVCDCDEGRLNAAVRDGICRARRDRLDHRTCFKLAAACMITAVLCFTMNSAPAKAMAGDYLTGRSRTMQEDIQALDGYIRDLTNIVRAYCHTHDLGGN